MSTNDRKKRKLARARRHRARLSQGKLSLLRQLASDMARLKATITLYGLDAEVSYLAVAVHAGSDLRVQRFFEATDFPGPEQMVEEAVSFARIAGAEQICIIEGMLAPEFCACGERHARIFDVLPPGVCRTLGLPEGSTFAAVRRLIAECN